MDNSFHTSFIPKKPVVSNGRSVQNRSLNIFSILATLVLLFVILSAVGLFFYKEYLNKQLLSKSDSLRITRESLEEKTLIDLQTFDRRLESSKNLISKHTVISPFFDILSSVTHPDVQFNSFSGVMSSDGKGLAVSMGGLAKDYRTVAIQSDILNSDKAKAFTDVSFQDLKLSDGKNTKGHVNFKVSFFVDPSFLSFENYILKNNDINVETKDLTKEDDTSKKSNIENTKIESNLNVVDKVNLPKNTSNQ